VERARRRRNVSTYTAQNDKAEKREGRFHRETETAVTRRWYCRWHACNPHPSDHLLPPLLALLRLPVATPIVQVTLFLCPGTLLHTRLQNAGETSEVRDQLPLPVQVKRSTPSPPSVRRRGFSLPPRQCSDLALSVEFGPSVHLWGKMPDRAPGAHLFLAQSPEKLPCSGGEAPDGDYSPPPCFPRCQKRGNLNTPEGDTAEGM
jgi:hypothetical protein